MIALSNGTQALGRLNAVSHSHGTDNHAAF